MTILPFPRRPSEPSEPSEPSAPAPAPAVVAVPSGDPGPEAFSLAGELPTGATLLEASAGTGKTYAVAGLATRYLAEGLPADSLLVVTFTRAATGELRDRVRSRLVQTLAALTVRSSTPEAPAPPALGQDPLLAVLTRGTPVEVAQRRANLSRAVAEFDAATITTIHGFCIEVLAGLGTAADRDQVARFEADTSDLVDQVVDDLFVRKYLRQTPHFSATVARQVVTEAVAHRDAALLPTDGPPSAVKAVTRARLGRAARHEVARRAQLAGIYGWDDLLDQLADSLDRDRNPELAGRAIELLRRRYRVVLVDEFQDTDPVQWRIFREAFGQGHTPLTLIGDPKQAIYSFRGADVTAYLEAGREAAHHATLTTNWRSDQGLLDALDTLLAGATFGDAQIPYRRVAAAPSHLAPGLIGHPSPFPLRFRFIHRQDQMVELTPSKGLAQADSARQLIAQDLAADIVAVLEAGTTRRSDGAEPRPLHAGDLAVLVQTNREAGIVQLALERVGVPAVVGGASGVFTSPSGAAWLTFLEGLEQPASPPRARSVALTPFVGWDADRLGSAEATELDELQARLHRWAGLLADAGVAALFQTVSHEVGMPARELARVGGERRLTDLAHVAELLHAEAIRSRLALRGLTTWLRERIAEGTGPDSGDDTRARRLESDDEAVQIMTVHRAKGLEFPVVYLPYLAMTRTAAEDWPLFHDPDTKQRCLDLGGREHPDFRRHADLAKAERRGEDLRVAYVALTRACHQVVAWWVTGNDADGSPLGRLLFGRGPGGALADPPTPLPKGDDALLEQLAALAERGRGLIGVERVARPASSRWSGRPVRTEELSVSRFDRELDATWRRSSYTALTEGVHGRRLEPMVASEAERPGLSDESVPAPGVGPAPVLPPAPAEARPAPLASAPAGAAFGIAVHAALEAVDFDAPDLERLLRHQLQEPAGRGQTPLGPEEASITAAGLALALATPLGGGAGDLRLIDVNRRHRLDELGFELPLVGGDDPRGELDISAIARLVRRHLTASDPLAAYPDDLDDPALAQQLRGYLTGSIDLVLRVPAPAGDRHLVIDYKTNWLAPPGEALRVEHYRPSALIPAMRREHYPLQALLYSVALHRFLRWRLPDYRPEAHLGGVLYLFLRGMAGPGTPMLDGGRCGVFAWSPPPALVAELSDLLEEGSGARP